MTKEQFDKAIKINERIKDLEEVKKEIYPEKKHFLSYMFQYDDGDYKPCCKYDMRNIEDILDKHDMMIRKEIDEEIEKLQKEIEKL